MLQYFIKTKLMKSKTQLMYTIERFYLFLHLILLITADYFNYSN